MLTESPARPKPIGDVRNDLREIIDAIEKRGNMGLRGIWAQVANASAMTVLGVVLFMTMHDVRTMHNEGMSMMKSLLESNVINQNKVIQDNTDAIRDLAAEVRLLRADRQK